MSVLQHELNQDLAQPLVTFNELTLVEDKLREILEDSQGIIRDACLSLLNSGGKRIRPLLTLTSGLCFNQLNDEMIYSAAAAELIHMASLVHDDIIDASTTRRNLPTVNALHGSKAAVLSGDYIFAEAFNILASHNLLTNMGFLVDAIKQMCEGEVNQAAELFSADLSIEQYYSRITKKTGVLLAACCKSGAAAAGASDWEISLLGSYGLFLGFAYQIIDDILDFSGDEDHLGKPTGLDLLSGNFTLPLILLRSDRTYSDWIYDLMSRRQITTADILQIKDALRNSGALEQAYLIASDCSDKAKLNLSSIPDSHYKNNLLDLADMVLKREH